MDPNLVSWIGGGGFTGLLSAGLYAILTGKLVPKGTVDSRIADKDAQLQDTQELVALWQAAAKISNEALKELIPLSTEQAENSRITVKMIKGLYKAATGRDPIDL